MSSDSKLNALIVQNINDLDATAKQIEVIGAHVWKLITDEARQWVTEQKWCQLDNGDSFWFWPPGWTQEEDNSPIRYFYFDKGPDDTGSGAPGEPYFWLSRYLGQAGGEFCVWFEPNISDKKTRKQIISPIAADLRSKGANISDYCYVYTPCSLNFSAVAEGFDIGNFEEALKPIKQALDCANELYPLLDAALD
jgi:hypothetical protein